MGIEKVITGIGGLVHSDERRDLYTLYNGIKIDGKKISAQQIKLAKIKNEKDVILGGHYHNYWEYFSMISGKAKFILEDIKTKKRRKVDLDEKSGGLLIPSYVAHKAEIEKNSILIGATEENYVNAEHNDKKYAL